MPPTAGAFPAPAASRATSTTAGARPRSRARHGLHGLHASTAERKPTDARVPASPTITPATDPQTRRPCSAPVGTRIALDDGLPLSSDGSQLSTPVLSLRPHPCGCPRRDGSSARVLALWRHPPGELARAHERRDARRSRGAARPRVRGRARRCRDRPGRTPLVGAPAVRVVGSRLAFFGHGVVRGLSAPCVFRLPSLERPAGGCPAGAVDHSDAGIRIRAAPLRRSSGVPTR